jgi:hypothetical protein
VPDLPAAWKERKEANPKKSTKRQFMKKMVFLFNKIYTLHTLSNLEHNFSLIYVQIPPNQGQWSMKEMGVGVDREMSFHWKYF